MKDMEEKANEGKKPICLVGVHGPYKGHEFEIGAMMTSIGGDYSDVDLSQDATVAPQHCWIEQVDGMFWLFDADDSGGIYLGDSAIKKARLMHGDLIKIGMTTFRWKDEGNAGLSPRGLDEIEYATIAPTSPPKIHRAGIDPDFNSKQAPPFDRGVKLEAKTIFIFLFAIFIIYFIFGYLMVPSSETRTIALELEDYWMDFNSLLSLEVASLNMSAIMFEAEDFEYGDLELIQLSNTPFTSLPGPNKTRMKNLNRIKVVMRGMDAMNIIHIDNEPADKYKALFTAVNTIKEIDLSKDKDYGNRRDWLVLKFESIIEQLKKDCKIELSDFLPAAPPPPTKKSQEALDYFYSGYYLLGEGYGIRGISNTLAAKAFGYLETSRDMYRDILHSDRNNKRAITLIILCDYLMVDIRMNKTTKWKSRYIRESASLLEEGYRMMNSISNEDFERYVPKDVDDHSLRQISRFRAKFCPLIDNFEK